MVPGILWSQFDSPVKTDQGLFPHFKLGVGPAQAGMVSCFLGAQFGRPPVFVQGQVQTFYLFIQPGQLKVSPAQLGIVIQGAEVAGFRLVQVPELAMVTV